jgi:predicted phosphate transport protein (TIGR00153 family)
MVVDGALKMIFKKEKEAMDLMAKHLDKVKECLKTATITVETYLKGDVSEAEFFAHRMEEIETEANYIGYGICDKLYNGAYLPILRGHIYSIVKRLEKVVAAAKTCCDFFLDQRPEIPESLKEQFIRAIRESFSIIDPLRGGALSYLNGDGEIDIIREKAKQVEIKKSDVDKIERELTRQIFSVPIDPWHKMHLRICLGTIVKVPSQALEAADELEMVTLKMRV